MSVHTEEIKEEFTSEEEELAPEEEELEEFADYVPSVVYDPSVSLHALSPASHYDFITNKYYRSAIIRFFKVLACVLKIIIDNWYDNQKWTYFRQWVVTGNVDKAESKRKIRRASWLREKLLEFGPTFIKLGQALSTRADLLRKEYIDELSKLQDKVPPFPIEIVNETILNELGEHPDDVFEEFYPNHIAAASLGQVHKAILKTGETVVIKIQRPGLIDLFNLDVAILKRIAKFCHTFFTFAQDRNWPDIVDEFGKTLFEEIDYVLEAKNASTFRKNFVHSDKVYIPKIFSDLTTRKVIVMEYKPGIKIDNLAKLDAEGVDRERLSKDLVEAYLQQFLKDGIYHADPHPGNLAIDRVTHQIIFYDYGMVGRIDSKTRVKIINAFMNLVERRADALLNNLIELKMLDKNTADLDKIRGLIQWTLNNYYDVPFEEVKFGEITDELADVMYAFPFRLPASFTYIVRAIVTLEGLSIKLNPRIAFMEIAVTYARRHMNRSELFDLFSFDRNSAIVRSIAEVIEELFGIDLLAGRHKHMPGAIDSDDIELIRSTIINGFGVIGFGLMLCMVFIAISIFTAMTGEFILQLIGLIGLFLVIPLYFGILLAVLMSKPKKSKEMLKRKIQDRNKFTY